MMGAFLIERKYLYNMLEISNQIVGYELSNIDACDDSYLPNPVLVIIDVQPKELGIPTKAYYAIEEVKEVSNRNVLILLC